MIAVRMARQGGWLLGYSVQGHAPQDEPQGDLHCAAVSVLATSTINTLTEVCHLSEHVEYEFSEGDLWVRLDWASLSEREREDSQISLQGFAINVEDLAEQFPKSVNITYEEVEI